MTIVRSESPSDIAPIRAVHVACFPTDAEALLVDRLRDAGRLTVSMVAEIDEQVVGHVALSPVSATAASPGVGLAPLAVLPGYRGRGTAAELVRQSLARGAALGLGWAVVLGDPAYYARFGFGPAAESGLTDEYGGGPAFQVVELVEGRLPAGAGLVRYAPEFASL